MARRWLFLSCLLCACATPATSSLWRVDTPHTLTVGQVDDYHGVRVEDPYRWLEDDNSAETAAWVASENAVTGSVLSHLPARKELNARLTALWNYARITAPTKHGALWGWSRNDGLQPQNVSAAGAQPGVESRVLLDPNTWSKDGTVALGEESWSLDGRLLAYTVAEGGSDWRVVHVKDVGSGNDLPDRLEHVKFSTPAWRTDGSGFFYSRYPAPAPGEELSASNHDMAVYFHRLGELQDADVLVHREPAQPKWNFTAFTTDDGRWLGLYTYRGEPGRNLLHVRPVGAPDAPLVALEATWETQLTYVGNDGDRFYCITNWQAPRGRLVVIDAAHPARDQWQTLIPESDAPLQGAALFGDTLVLTRMRDAHHVVTLADLHTGVERPLALPGLGTVSGFDGARTDTETCFAFTSFTDPGAVWKLELPSGRTTQVWRPKVSFAPDDFVTEQVWYASKDGTQVPMFLVHRPGVRPDGARPVYLYGYGGFDVSLTPAFNVSLIPLLEHGGVFAQPNLRGGGEYGEAWHEAGMLARKQNVFDDFLGAAQWLIDSGWTRSERLAIGGRSNGGLLVGAALTQRPDLFGCAVPGVGVMDMLRYHRFTIGWAWVGEYGSADDADQFPFLRAYSPLHNIRPGTHYPPTLILTADHDDRVVPAHSFKFAAALQAAQGGDAPILIRIETRAGHGSGKPLDKRISEAADSMAFMFAALGVN